MTVRASHGFNGPAHDREGAAVHEHHEHEGEVPATGPISPRQEGAGSCRKCPVWCDRVVEPAGCFASSCPMLYSYDERGRRFFGCMQRIFDVEVDLEGFRRGERTRAGFGGLRIAREPLAICRIAIDPSHPDRAERPCLAPEFLFSAAVPPEVSEDGVVGGRDEG